MPRTAQTKTKSTNMLWTHHRPTLTPYDFVIKCNWTLSTLNCLHIVYGKVDMLHTDSEQSECTQHRSYKGQRLKYISKTLKHPVFYRRPLIPMLVHPSHITQSRVPSRQSKYLKNTIQIKRRKSHSINPPAKPLFTISLFILNYAKMNSYPE